MTRDRVSYDATWNGRAFTVVDTGGWDPDARGLAERIAAQAEVAVDHRRRRAVRGRRHRRHHRRRRGRRADPAHVRQAGRSWPPTRSTTSAPRPRPTGCGTSGWASRSRSRRCTAAARATCSTRSSPRCPSRRPRRSARSAARAGSPSSASPTSASRRCSTSWPGRSGSSSTTSPAPPSTRSTSWSSSAGRAWRFIDTAGIRKRVKEASGHEYYAACAPSTAIERAEVCVVVVDGSQPISEQDLRIITAVAEAGRALVIAFNKWDLVDEERRYYLDREIERDLVRVQWAPRINITARTGWHVDRLVPALDAALEGWSTRVGTGALNAFLGRLVAEHPHPVRGGKQPQDPVRHPGRRPSRRRSCCSPAACSRRRTCASSSAGCARSSASSAARCTCSSARARSASAADPALGRLRRPAPCDEGRPWRCATRRRVGPGDASRSRRGSGRRSRSRSCGRGATLVPSTAVIVSPATMPALAAGVPG